MWRAFERAGYKATNKISKALVRKKRAKIAAKVVVVKLKKKPVAPRRKVRG
jgi:hypothetical protein